MDQIFNEAKNKAKTSNKKCLNCQYFIDYVDVEDEGFCEISRDDVKQYFMCNQFMDAQTQIEIHRSDIDEILKDL